MYDVQLPLVSELPTPTLPHPSRLTPRVIRPPYKKCFATKKPCVAHTFKKLSSYTLHSFLVNSKKIGLCRESGFYRFLLKRLVIRTIFYFSSFLRSFTPLLHEYSKSTDKTQHNNHHWRQFFVLQKGFLEGEWGCFHTLW